MIKPKFYLLKDMDQDKLNDLALNRNNLQKRINNALELINDRCAIIKEQYQDSFDCCIEELSNIEKILKD